MTTTRQRARTRARNQHATQFTELWIISSPEEIATLMHLAKRSGLLAYASAPMPMGQGDPRHRRYLRLRTHANR